MCTNCLRRLRFLLGSILFAPLTAFAQLNVTIGTEFDAGTIIQRIINFLATSITAVASAMFVVGAFMIVLSGAKEDFKQQGKDLMIGSAMGIGVTLGAYAIWRTVMYFLISA